MTAAPRPDTPTAAAPTVADPAPMGVIHGRFQVLHNDHLRYLLAGYALCRHLVVGVTNPDPRLTRHEDADPGRSHAANNPLTYFERQAMIRAVLAEAGVDPGRLTVVPFPINFPELYRHYAPAQAVYFLSICDDWGRRKRDYLRSMGLRVHVLWEVEPQDKGISGIEVRRLMAEGKDWEALTPLAAARLCREWGLPERLRAAARPEPLP